MSKSENSLLPSVALSDAQWNQVNQAIGTLNASQLTWLSGYLAGVAQGGPVSTVAPATENTSSSSLTILYGSQTGNAKGVAQNLYQQVEAYGLPVSLLSMADYKPRNIKNESHLLVVTSTHGEGEAPDDAIELHEFLASKKAPKLNSVKFAVIGLGDSSYEFFCQTGKDFEQRLTKLGASPLHERLDCDVDYEADVAQWTEQLLPKLKTELQQPASVATSAAPSALSQGAQQYTKQSPYSAQLIESQKITGRDSVKDIRHIEISLEDSGIVYQPGDALGVWFSNDVELVDELIDLLALDPNDTISVQDESLSLRGALIDKFELTQAYPKFVDSYAQAIDSQALASKLEDKAALRDYLSTRQVVDIVREFPGKLSAQQLADSLRALTPRLYSIASSQADVEEEVHLTVAMVDYDVDGQARSGGASSFVGRRLEADQQVNVFVEHNDNFRLPENGDTPVIMIGPGTGVAPFRAFMQERDVEGAEGKNWLFFGNPNFTQDFLYQTEWQAWVKDGLVNKVSLAFSRDQTHKIYVQDRIREQGEELYQWLEQGAHLYVCGDATRMAKDVELALLDVVSQYGALDEQGAKQYLNDLRKAKRYQKDVY